MSVLACKVLTQKMLFTKIILSPITQEVTFDELERLFTKCNTTSIYISHRKESSFDEYAEGFAIIEFAAEYDALAWNAAQSGKVEFNGHTFSAILFDGDYSPIEKLTDQCLQRIFSMLPVSKGLDVEKVCKRWKKVVGQCSYDDSKLDIRDFSTFQDAEKYIIKCGFNLTEIYYNINSPVSLLAKHCDNLENLTIDYEENSKFCDRRDVQKCSMWNQFRCLSRVTLKNIRNSDCNFLRYLPETVIELQLLNLPDNPQTHRRRYETLVDLSNLPNLQSLKLIGFEFTDGLLVGFTELEKLSHLFIENCRLSQKHQLCSFETLEHLTVKNLLANNTQDWYRVFDNNDNLKYLEINCMTDNPFRRAPRSTSLQHLQYLRVNNVQWDNIHWIPKCGLPRLEYLDCQQLSNITGYELSKIVKASPNLRFLDARGCRVRSGTVELIKSVKLNQANEVILKLFVGDCGWYRRIWPTHFSSHFVVDKVPREEDKMPDVNHGQWFTKDCETIKKVSVVLPILDDSSPIQKLPTECLCMIFSHLSMDDRLRVEEVCQRWKSIVFTMWSNPKKFDVFHLRYSENAKKCVERCGEKLEEIYYYKDHALSVIAECCSNVKNVTIDFQDRMYRGEKRRGKHYVPDLQPTLMQLKNLTHLTLGKIDQKCNFDFLKDLPETMVEIHVSPEYEFTVADINVGKFTQLSALTLNNFLYDATPSYVPIRGIEKLEKLRYLGLESWCIRNCTSNPLRNLTNLEYLSLENTTGFRETDMLSVLNSNANIKSLNILRFSPLTLQIWRAISSRHLEALCYGADFDLNCDDDSHDESSDEDDV